MLPVCISGGGGCLACVSELVSDYMKKANCLVKLSGDDNGNS